MTFPDFIIKWQGRYLDFDGVYGAQCFDLLHQYVVECLGLTDARILSAPAAKDIYNNFDGLYGHDLFDKTANTPEGVPQEGDIVVWGMGQYGHVAIFIDGDVNKFNSLDQNYPTGSPIHVQSHTYKDCLGWLRYKGGEQNQQALIDELRKARDDNWNQYIELLTQFEGLKTENETLRNTQKRNDENYQSQLQQFASILDPNNPSTDTAEIAGKIMELVGIEDRLRKAQEKIDTLTKEAIDDQKTIDNTEKELKEASRAVSDLSEAKKQANNDLIACQKQLSPDKLTFWDRLKFLFKGR